MSEIDHDYTDNVICPHCGYEERDSWELGGDDDSAGEADCPECGMEFRWVCHVSIKYSTKKKEPADV